ncbi:MAG TPA: hypothetical protein VGI19_19980 [Candidatus Cybelea sp.]
MKRLALLLAALLALTGEGPGAPVRHLEYAFAIYPTAKPNGGLYNGTLSVDVVGTAPDGGTLVQASEFWYYTLRPRQTIQCEVYPGGNVRCDDVPPYPSQTELVLLPLLARNFFSVGSENGAPSWQQKFTLTFSKGLYVTAASLHLSATPLGGRIVTVTSNGVFQQLDRRQQKALEEGRFVYDRATSTPIFVHEVRSPTPTASVYSQTGVDLQLMKDSAGTNAPVPQPRFQNNQQPSNGVPGAPLSVPLPKATGGPEH